MALLEKAGEQAREQADPPPAPRSLGGVSWWGMRVLGCLLLLDPAVAETPPAGHNNTPRYRLGASLAEFASVIASFRRVRVHWLGVSKTRKFARLRELTSRQNLKPRFHYSRIDQLRSTGSPERSGSGSSEGSSSVPPRMRRCTDLREGSSSVPKIRIFARDLPVYHEKSTDLPVSIWILECTHPDAAAWRVPAFLASWARVRGAVLPEQRILRIWPVSAAALFSYLCGGRQDTARL